MKLTIEVSDDFLERARSESGEDGSNDKEHELLVEVVDAIAGAQGTFVVEQTEQFRVRAFSADEAIVKLAAFESDDSDDRRFHHPDVEFIGCIDRTATEETS